MRKQMAVMFVLALWLGGCSAPTASPAGDAATTTTSVATTTTATTTQGAPVLREEGTCRRVTGAWETLLTDATEKQEQVDGYALLKKLRHKEQALGCAFSAKFIGCLTIQGQSYYLCELGHWITEDSGSRYEFVTRLMVPIDLSAAYGAVSEGDLVWDTADDWLK